MKICTVVGRRHQRNHHRARRRGRRPAAAGHFDSDVLVGFVSAQSKEPEAAKALLRYLSSPEAAAVYKERGMQPGR